jgi:hypothetical protein
MGCGACCIWSLTTRVAGEVENKASWNTLDVEGVLFGFRSAPA